MSSTRRFINPLNKYDRVVLLIDMDCFYCQVEEKLNPSLAGKPIAVVQYNAWRGGGIIAVNYAARGQGVTRHMRGDEAREQCPDIELVQVPSVREKADLTKYREAGKEVANVLQKFTSLLERASVDEAYLDITEQVNKRFKEMDDGIFELKPVGFNNTYAVGYEYFGRYINEITTKMSKSFFYDDEDAFDGTCEEEASAIRKSDLKLLIGASISNEIRAKVKEITGYDCSAGIAHNKILAKLACGINKPNKQTVLSLKQIPILFRTLPIGKIKGLGGKYGEDVCATLKIKFLGDLLNFSEAELQRKFDDKNGSWLYLMAQGIDLEAVTPRFYSKSIGCCKKFPGLNALFTVKKLKNWLNELSNEIADRLDKDIIENNRRAKHMVVSFIQEINGEDVSSSRSTPLSSYEPEVIANDSLELIKKNTESFLKASCKEELINPIKFLGISVGKFENIENNQSTLKQMFANHKKIENIQKVEALEPTSQVNNVGNSKKTVYDFFTSNKKKDDLLITSTNETIRESESTSVKVNNLETIQEGTNVLNNLNNEVAVIVEPCVPNKNQEERSFFRRILGERTSPLNTIKNQEESIDFTEHKITIISTVQENQSKDVIDCQIIQGEQSVDQNSSEIKKLPQTKHHIKSFFANQTIKRKSENSDDVNVKESKLCVTENDESSESFPHFSKTYVELATPEIRQEYLIKCTTCGVDILNEERTIQSHNDRHFAEQLSQQQREEFRNEFRSKIKSPPQKKMKTKQVRTEKTSTITKYLKKPHEPEIVASTSAISSQHRCAECGIFVEISKMPEHSDYHMAKKIQLELNKSEMKTVSVQKTNNSPINRKSKNVSLTKSFLYSNKN